MRKRIRRRLFPGPLKRRRVMYDTLALICMMPMVYVSEASFATMAFMVFFALWYSEECTMLRMKPGLR